MCGSSYLARPFQPRWTGLKVRVGNDFYILQRVAGDGFPDDMPTYESLPMFKQRGRSDRSQSNRVVRTNRSMQ